MTFVEFFDSTAAENVCTCLAKVPDRVILVGKSANLMEKHIANYTQVFAGRGHNVAFRSIAVSTSDLAEAVMTLSGIVEEYPDCVFDITGGEEILSVALGIVMERNKEKNIQLHRYSIYSNALQDCDQDGNTVEGVAPSLSVSENVRIYGGVVSEEKSSHWDLTPEFEADVEAMWQICRNECDHMKRWSREDRMDALRKNVRYWNTQIGVLEEANKQHGSNSPDGLTVTADVVRLQNELKRRKCNFVFSGRVLGQLYDKGLITHYECNENDLIVGFKDHQVKKCLTNAGLVLEMKIYLAALHCRDKGQPVYNDVRNGVVIDWDGKLHEADGTFRDTENEIDVFLMHGMMPLFVSCKNGVVTAEEIYKLNTVAQRFGGKYAKKILFATALDEDNIYDQNTIQRARDTGIIPITDLLDMSREKFEKTIKNLWTRTV